MAFIKRTKFHMKWRIFLYTVFLVVLQILNVSSQTNDPGGTQEIITVHYDISEELSKDSYVATLPIKQGYLYHIQDQQNLFKLNATTGVITTKVVIDREALSQNMQSFFVTGSSSSSSLQHPINVQIRILDINDNAPTFKNQSVTIIFSENVDPKDPSHPTEVTIGVPTASDPDDGENGRVSNYTIVSRDDENKFAILYDFKVYGEVLIVKSLEKLDREERSTYQINVSVQDNGSPPKFGHLQIFIKVGDKNDNPPIFDQSQYKATINESAPEGTLVIHVAASDGDIGKNSDITYFLEDQSEQFEIDSKTGEIRTKKTPLHCRQRCERSASTDIFDCEPYSCPLTVKTVDGGSPVLKGRAYISVKVVDENNHAPTISIKNFPDDKQPHSTVSENANIPTTVALVTVTDADPGSSISALSIISGNEKGHFEMITTSDFKFCSVRLVGALDRERISMYNMTLQVFDSGNPPKSSVSFLVVYVIDINDHVPQFTKTEYRVSLSETLSVGSYVESLTAHDEDSGQNADLTYAVVSGNERGWFKLDPKTGLLTVNAKLHYDMATIIVMNISVHDGGPKPFYNYTTVIISIVDENDKAPEFASTTFDITLDENLASGYEILKATATDKDSGLNGTVLYELHREVQIRYPNTFNININNGKLTTLKILDREVLSNYEIKIIAKDQGPQPLSSTATVNLKIADQNDNKPIFYPEKYFVNFEDNQPIGTFVVQVSANDLDYGSNAKITYSFVYNYPDFSIEMDTGKITTTQVLTSNTQKSHTLEVLATDSNPTHTSDNKGVVKITLVTGNEVGPAFQNLPYLFTVTEDAGSVSNSVKQVGSVSAVVLGKTVRYEIVSGDLNKIFNIGEFSGVITAVKGIDREEKSSYTLRVVAYADSKSSEIDVKININDVNDHAPKFHIINNEVYVLENLPEGHEVYLAAATDLDAGMNSVITYTLQPSTNLFTIDRNTGMISLSTSIQKMTSVDRSYQLTVTATDGGSNPQLSSSQQVTMVIADVNDHTPVFTHSSYEISLNESILVNEQFLILKALDKDSGENAKISYNITRGNGDLYFGIFPTGALYVAKQLDREKRDHYQLTIVAMDNGQEHRSSAVNVTVHILDNNDNKPYFVNTTYTMSIKENSLPQTFVGSVSATDEDIGRNAELSYFLSTGQESFSVDIQTGEIRSRKVFDREHLFDTTGETYITIEVIVMDNGLVKLKDKASVDIYILDENDNSPTCNEAIYRASLYENAAKYSPVVKVTATDKDSRENQALTYSIISGNEDSQFEINSGNGQISLVGFVDRESQDNYVLKVLTTDSGADNQNSAICDVSIAIKDVNDNNPLFAQSVYEVVLSEYRVVGDEIIQFSATDIDLGINAQIIYSVSGSDGTFIIDSNTGKLYLDKNLDYETKNEYKLKVSATDKGSPQVLPAYSSVTVKVTDENDNAPKFINSPNAASITENANTYASIMKVSAQDEDSGLNGQITYSIINQEPVTDMFTINPDIGTISFTGTYLDREKVSSFALTVVATDRAVMNKKSAEQTITISVIDENDNGPLFLSPNAIRLEYPTSVGKFATILAEDLDSGNNGRVSYTLLTQSSYFNVDVTTGDLSLTNALPSSMGTYTLRVKASDNGNTQKTKEMDFTIIQVPKNGNGPNFDSSSYSAEIMENEGAGKSLLTIGTSSSANVKYYITGIYTDKKTGQLFQIGETTGLFTNSIAIDREVHGSKINVTVCAVLTTQTSPNAKCTEVVVTVQDKNATPPKFSQNLYRHPVLENTPVGTKVFTVGVTDEDTIGQLSFTIRSGGDGLFTINNAGEISILSILNRENKEKHTLVIEASDGKQTSTAKVWITVQDVNDNAPEFDKSLYTFDISEDSAVGTILGRVHANDEDEEVNGEVFYTLMSTWGTDLFMLDLNRGTFTLRGNLDFEQVHFYTLKVKAEDRGDPSLTSTVTVIMNIQDVNDNEPVFDPQSYSAEVKEDVAIGTSVAMVSATDIDSGLNGMIYYDIFDGDILGQFGVGRENGTLFTRKKLDRETTASYDLIVKATDQAEPPSVRRSTTTQVSVIMKDVNDNAPVFTTPSIMSVPEDRPINNVAFVVMAEDKDKGNNSLVYFSLAYHPQPPFRINPLTGEMLVNTVLDRETTPNYTVTVTAYDRGSPAMSTVQSLVIKISDINDNTPIFSPTSYNKVIAENTAIGTNLLTVTATDIDEGLNGNVRFFIVEGDSNFDFTIDQSSGVIRVQKHLDYERVQSYNLKIQAEDRGSNPKSAYADVTIKILDINDNVPIFVNSPYYPLVQEEADTLPVHVVQVSARDEDSEVNNKVTYGFRKGDRVDGKVVFEMNNTSGEITCLKKLDRELVDEYELIIVAIDSGIPSLTGTGTVVVKVQDINDHAPEFEHSSVYIGHVEENQLGSTDILTVKAADKDDGPNAQIIYSLEDSFGGKFFIHPTSGQLIAATPLDREEHDTYHLKVIARDSALIPKQVIADVTIIVDDKNDNTPEFEKQSYQQTVNNPTQTGEFVLGVTALDRDTGGNGQVVYTLTGTDKFVINGNTGILTASQTLNVARETYTCVIKAEDQGIPRRSSSVNVTVTVSDISSDNKPQFTVFQTPQKMDENTAAGHSITTVTASSSSGNVKYYIAGGNVGSAFSIRESSGEITVLHPVDYEMTNTFDLWIEARDATNMALSTFRKMVINVEDLNDNVPRFAQPLYTPSILEDASRGASVIQILASDGDSGNNGKISYRLATSDTTFLIDQNTGLITTNVTLNREAIDMYSLIVEAVDQGTTPQTGSTTVRIIIEDVNDNNPIFSDIFNIEILEDMAIGSFIVQVTSSDADIGENAKVTYSIVKNPEGKFKIDPSSGNITLIGKLDAEVHGGPNSQGMKIEIVANDNAHATHGFVNVYVADVNDNTPKFLPPLGFSLIEGLPTGTAVGKVRATDADISKPNNQLYYSFKISSAEFDIDDESGEITSKVDMVYIHDMEYPNVNTRELVVIATDFGTPARSSEAIIHIQITDANDHTPMFEHRQYYSAVPYNVKIGDHVMTVVAVDKLDYGLNAEVEYFKDGGSGASYFYVHKVTGEITIHDNSLQSQQNKEFTLIVKAQDKGIPPRSVTQEVRFTITGINQYSPVFTTTDLQTTIPENTLIGANVAYVLANDNDLTGPNGEITYHIIDGDAKGLFSIDQSRGNISVHHPLDYETTKQHTLTIMARDQGLFYRNATVVYIIHVTDVNDNAPIFNKTNFVVSVNENTPNGVAITTITATDADSGNNANIEYSFGYVQTLNLFTIDRFTGTLKTKAPLDYEQKTSYNVLIVAVNPGTQFKNTTEVLIEVAGVNEFFPKFVQKDYSFSIKESIAIGTVLGSVVATDDDDGEDGIVYYYLVSASNMKGFKMDYKTGAIIVSGRPDYESSPHIILTVMAKNWGSIKGGDTDECNVTITVEDANDPPVFSKQLYLGSVQENSNGGVSVKQVAATDTDHNPNDQAFVFTILHGDEGLFRIDQYGWIITTGAGVLDRETQYMYNVTVGAIDSGTVPQTGSAVVQITLEDVNDNGPEFVSNNVTGYIMENQQGGVSVITLQDFTTDPDLPPNQGPYKYTIQGTSNYFLINEITGLVTSKAPIDREQLPKFDIGVVVSDGGQPTQSSTLTFAVEVQDQNDTPPSPRNMVIQVALFDGRIPSGPIADVRPIDPDVIGQYTCTIETQQNIFYISIGCKLNIINQPTSDSKITISGSDGGQHGQVTYTADFQFLQFNNKTLDNTVILKVNNIVAEDFVKNKLNDMKQSVKGLFSPTHSVRIYSVKSVETASLVYLAVANQEGTLILHDILKQQILNKKTDMESELGISIQDVGYSPCTASMCNSGECSNRIEVGNSVNAVDSDYLIVSSPDLAVSYYCSCLPQYTGDHCEVAVSPCGEGHCQNGGFCTANSVCDCPSGWSGTYCEKDINECLDSPCLNGGECQNTQGSYICNCKAGFTGTSCENGSDRCKSNPCVRGVCKNLIGSFACDCPFTYWGNLCQHTSVGFSVGSFKQFSSLSTSTNDNTFDLTFATVKTRALLLYNPAESVTSSEFLALEILNGEVRFSFNLGDVQTTRLTVPKNVSTGEWFRVQVNRSRENAQLRVNSCPNGGSDCPECSDSSCLRQGSQTSRKLNLGNQPVTLGGIDDIDVALQHRGQIESHDFVGCMRNFIINGEDYLHLKIPLKEQGIDSNSCPRQQGQSACTGFVCQNGGICVDEWNTASCRCNPGFHGNQCQQEFKPFGFGASSYVVFKQKESYRRDGLLTSSNRRRRSTHTSSIFIRFRTTSSTGLLFYADRGSRSAVLYVDGNTLKYTIVDSTANNEDTLVVTDSSLTDGSWHNVTVIVTGTTVVMTVDHRSSSQDGLQSAFKFSDVHVTQMALGGTTSPVYISGGATALTGFGGCISEFELDEAATPLNGTTDRFIIETSSGVENGCNGLCISAGCVGSCTVEGEVAKCAVVPEDEPLGIGVIVVIAFFGVLLIVIVVIFLVYRCYRQRREDSGKQNGHVNKSFGSGHSPAEDSGFGDHDDFIQRHVNQNIKQSSHYAVSNGRLPSRPDIIISESGRRSALPLEIDDGTVIIDNGDVHLTGGNEDSPELYDLENASSIAPSDIDVSYYYGASRHGKGPSYRNNYNQRHMLPKSNGHGPPSYHWNSNGSRESPGALRMQTTAMQNRNSPANMLANQHSNPQNRYSPASQYSARSSPMNQLNRQSPHLRASPLVQANVRGTPDIHHGRTDSDHSVISHHSHHSISSTSSVSRMAPLPNGHIKHSTGKRLVPVNRIPSNHSRPVKGLTIEEIEKLNSRPSRPSPVSMLEAVSSSDEGTRRNQQFKIKDHLDDGAMLEPLDSSSDESANDSFTCSEFEYENDKGRSEFDPSAMIYSKLAEVDNENDDFNVNHNFRNDGLDSNGSSFASSEEGKRNGAPINGAINWDYFTDWGPSFEKLVGVFKDIASLPDGDEHTNSNIDCRTETEEYV